GKVYTFVLRNDVYFHANEDFGKNKTRKVVAKDFVYSLNRIKDPKIASPGLWVLDGVASYQAINDTVLEIKLKEPFPAFLGLISMKYCSVVPKEVIEKGDFNTTPIGTGPFYLKYWKSNIKMVFRKNLLYFEKDKKGKKLPYLEAININFKTEKHIEFSEFLLGKLDFLEGINDTYKDELINSNGELNKKYANKYVMIRKPYLNTDYLCFYLNNNKAIDSNLRKAIAYGFDKVKMIKYLRNNIGYAAIGGFIPIGMEAYSKDIGYEYNPELAKEYIKTYLKENKKLPLIKLTTVQNYQDLCEYIQGQLSQIGLPIEIEILPPAILKENKSTGKINLFRLGWVADYSDEENFLSIFYSKNFSPLGPNYSHFKSLEYDILYENSKKTTNKAERIKLYKKMDQIIMQELPVIPLYHDEVVFFLSKSIKGFDVNSINLLNLKNVYKE
ncbi:MAG: ABC transporter substrate-binding protein, partial [Solirubrobacteraceae bacterium]